MSRVRTRSVKRASQKLKDIYYRRLTCDFSINKKIVDEVAEIHTKRLRNKITGYITHLIRHDHRRAQKVELERHIDFLPETLTFYDDALEVDKDTMAMLRVVDMSNLTSISIRQPRKKFTSLVFFLCMRF